MARKRFTATQAMKLTPVEISTLTERDKRSVFSALAGAVNKRQKRLEEQYLSKYTDFYEGSTSRHHYTLSDLDYADPTAIITHLQKLYGNVGNTVTYAKKKREIYRRAGEQYDDEIGELLEVYRAHYGDEYIYTDEASYEIASEDFKDYLKRKISEAEEEQKRQEELFNTGW